MTVQTKTDSDWFTLLSDDSMTKPLWVLFGKEGQQKSVSALNLCQSYSNQHPDITFVYMDVDDCPASVSLASVIQTPVHVLFIAGVEYKRIWRELDITSALINTFKQLFNESEIFSPEYFVCFRKGIWGSKFQAYGGTPLFIIDEDAIPWEGSTFQSYGGMPELDIDLIPGEWQGSKIQSYSGSPDLSIDLE
jgi:hypothetical protein